MKKIQDLVVIFFRQERSHKRIMENVFWLSFHRVVKIAFGMVLSVWLARHLGPVLYGKLNLASSIVALSSTIAILGLYGTVTKNLMMNLGPVGEILGTSFILRLSGGIFSAIIMIMSTYWIWPEDNLLLLLVIILGFTVPFAATDVIRYWLEARVESHIAARFDIAIFIVFAFIKFILLFRNASITDFVILMFFESIAASLSTLAVYKMRKGLFGTWSYSCSRASNLLLESWPVLLSAIATTAYTYIDLIMVSSFLDEQTVGIYAVATNISSAWLFFPLAIIASLSPALANAKSRSIEDYHEKLQALFDLLILIAVPVSIVICLCAQPLTDFMFGEDYSESAQILMILIWTGISYSLVYSSGRWYLLEGLQKLALLRNLVGMLACIFLNFLLIPVLGAKGAAISTLISVTSIAILFDLLFKETRILFEMKIRSLLVVGSLKRMKEMSYVFFGSNS